MTLATAAVIAVLVSLNGLYVAAEFAAVSVRRSRIRRLAGEGNRVAGALLPTLTDPVRLDRYVAACQVGITVSSLVLGAYGQRRLGDALTPLFESWGGMQLVAAQSTSVVVVLVALTTVQMILGELVPKSLALQYPTRVALLTVLPLRWSERAMAWFIAILNGSGWVVLRLMGVEPKAHRHLHSAEEIKFLVAESREGGHLDTEDQRRLNQALGLTRRSAREIMVPRTRVSAVDAAGGLGQAIEVATREAYTRLPVYRESLDDIVGLVHAKDLAAAAFAEDGSDDAPLDPLIRPILTVPSSVSIDRVLARMRDEQRVMAVVVDDFGGTAGILTTEDILSELLGDVGDEFKAGDPTPERLADGRVRLPGSLPVAQAGSWVNTMWEGQSDTVGGLVMERLGRVPAVGDALDIDGAQVEVESLDGIAVVSVLVRPAPDSPVEQGAEG